MTVLATVLIALAAAFIGFIIGCIVGISEDITTPNPIAQNPVKVFNAAELNPKEEVHEQVVLSKVVMPKRIKELEYNKRVNAALKEVIDKAVDVWVSGNSKPYKRSLANSLYHEWHVRLENANYRHYDPKLQCLNIVGRRTGSGFKFEAFWNEKLPKNI